MFVKKEFLKDLEKAHKLNMVSDEAYVIAKATVMGEDDDEVDYSDDDELGYDN